MIYMLIGPVHFATGFGLLLLLKDMHMQLRFITFFCLKTFTPNPGGIQRQKHNKGDGRKIKNGKPRRKHTEKKTRPSGLTTPAPSMDGEDMLQALLQ